MYKLILISVIVLLLSSCEITDWDRNRNCQMAVESILESTEGKFSEQLSEISKYCRKIYIEKIYETKN